MSESETKSKETFRQSGKTIRVAMGRESTTHHELAAFVHEKYPDILRDVHEVLRKHGLHELRVSSMEFVQHRGSQDEHKLLLQTSPCGPGMVAKEVCVPKVGGGVYCYTTCVPE